MCLCVFVYMSFLFVPHNAFPSIAEALVGWRIAYFPTKWSSSRRNLCANDERNDRSNDDRKDVVVVTRCAYCWRRILNKEGERRGEQVKCAMAITLQKRGPAEWFLTPEYRTWQRRSSLAASQEVTHKKHPKSHHAKVRVQLSTCFVCVSFLDVDVAPPQLARHCSSGAEKVSQKGHLLRNILLSTYTHPHTRRSSPHTAHANDLSSHPNRRHTFAANADFKYTSGEHPADTQHKTHIRCR